MAKKPLPPPKNPQPTPQPSPPAEGSPSSTDFEARLKALEDRLAYHEKLADLQAGLNDDLRLSMVCVLEAVKKAQSLTGVSLMPKGTFYGVRFP